MVEIRPSENILEFYSSEFTIDNDTNDGNVGFSAINTPSLESDATSVNIVDQAPISGLREVGAQPTSADLDIREWAWTDDHDGAGTAAWLYKNGAGSLYYFEPTGVK